MGGWVGGEVRARGEYRFSSLMKFKKKGGKIRYFAGKRKIFFYIYQVFTSPEKEKRSTIHY
jgi:hypothetical protein